MKAYSVVLLLLISSVLAGCASAGAPELRPYTAEESRELALEALNRRGLSFDAYQQEKARLLARPAAFDRQGEMSAQRNISRHQPAS
ncbi:hypothetical protein DNK59_23530 [Pseudomonas sp. TKO26]|uniref:Lipoprotein n=1 Tax=Pseudomonas saponiphila TaxID=556534 RepID=A0A1H4LDD8_9PSED|nr:MULTISPECIES: hypothetical protein [Pseudomonas]PYY81278.1 hypothetical protein DNK62_23530 [Pseudomonas sp. TKO30]PYY82749.1 hypothetical protein DNK61_22880 [Pseudomonas sp. TKO29]PYY84536.1 hypothetical protein DNK59_23530 [Pseudomonas sp. TKO26]PYY97672.1 hypothetical protein DNK60_24355 [Pseudomonas sp. TKO14]SEB68779.1 hypothetical protein SAMN05216178_1852 [Pseudomonas saponiphila]